MCNATGWFTLTFTMEEPTDEAAMICFSLGAQGEQIKEEHTVFIDNVSLNEVVE